MIQQRILMNKRTILVVVSITILAGVSGWGFWYWQNSAIQTKTTHIGQDGQMKIGASGEGTKVGASGEPITFTKKILCSQNVSGDGFEVCLDGIKEELARKNEEPVDKTQLDIDKFTNHHVQGRVSFVNNRKKDAIFYATDVYFTPDTDLTMVMKYGELHVVQDDANDLISCDERDGFLFPSEIFNECQKIQKSFDNGSSISIPSQWRLVSGDVNDGCSNPRYKGSAKVRAWMEWRTNYVGKSWLLHIDEQDLTKIVTSWPWKPYFNFLNLSESEQERLMNASQSNPITLNVKGISWYCEGQPALIF